jgi:hypothetical protein
LKFKIVLRMASSRVMICFVISELFSFLSTDSVILGVSCTGIFTYRSFMSQVILWFSFTFSFVKLSASVIEFVTLYWLLRCKWRLNISIRRFAILYDGSLMLFITGLLGFPGFCNFIWAFSMGDCDFFCYVFYLLLVNHQVIVLENFL